MDCELFMADQRLAPLHRRVDERDSALHLVRRGAALRADLIIHPSPRGQVMSRLGTGRHAELTEPIVASLGVEMLLALECF